MSEPEFAHLIPVSEWIDRGSLVHIKGKEDGQVYRVLKVNPKNLSMEDEEGRTWRLDKRAAVLAPRGTVFNAAPRPAVTEVWPGTVVTFTGDMMLRAPGKYVCIAQMGEGRAKFAKLNGDGGRYWRVSLTNVALSSAE